MEFEEKKNAIDRYSRRLKEMGPTVQALGWRDRAQQELRFSILAGIDDLTGCSILDVGCGFGDFYEYLQLQGKDVAYTGVDINPEIIDIARERHPKASFEVCDILESPLAKPFDYVVESGIFNFKIKDNVAFTQAMIKEMYRCCRRGMAANMMSAYVDYQDDHLHYFSPEEFFAFGKSLSQTVALRHDYPLYEFTIYIYRPSPVKVTASRDAVRS